MQEIGGSEIVFDSQIYLITLYDVPSGIWLILGASVIFVAVISIIIILIEQQVLRRFKYGSLSQCFGASFSMNLISTILGVLIASAGIKPVVSPPTLMPIYLMQMFGGNPEILSILLFFIGTFVISVGVEGLTLAYIGREHGHKRKDLWRMTLWANGFSYLFLIIVDGLVVFLSTAFRWY